MSGLQRTSRTLNKIIQFVHLVLCYGVTYSEAKVGNWLHNKAVARKNVGGGGGEACLLCPCTLLFCKVAVLSCKFGSREEAIALLPP